MHRLHTEYLIDLSFTFSHICRHNRRISSLFVTYTEIIQYVLGFRDYACTLFDKLIAAVAKRIVYPAGEGKYLFALIKSISDSNGC